MKSGVVRGVLVVLIVVAIAVAVYFTRAPQLAPQIQPPPGCDLPLSSGSDTRPTTQPSEDKRCTQYSWGFLNWGNPKYNPSLRAAGFGSGAEVGSAIDATMIANGLPNNPIASYDDVQAAKRWVMTDALEGTGISYEQPRLRVQSGLGGLGGNFNNFFTGKVIASAIADIPYAVVLMIRWNTDSGGGTHAVFCTRTNLEEKEVQFYCYDHPEQGGSVYRISVNIETSKVTGTRTPPTPPGGIPTAHNANGVVFGVVTEDYGY